MTCEEALRLLYEVIDKEASEYDVKRVEEHLHDCKDCMSRYQFEEMFKAFVVDKASAKSKSDQLKSSILKSIEVSKSHPRRSHGGPFRFGLVFAASAVALVLCIVAAFSVADFYRHKTQVCPFEKFHFDSTSARVDAASVPISKLVSARNFLANDMRYNFNSDIAGFRMVGAEIEQVLGYTFVHLRYHAGSEQVSLFIGSSESGGLPDFEKAIISGVEYFKHICNHCQVIYWIENGTISIAISENKDVDLTPLIPKDKSI